MKNSWLEIINEIRPIDKIMMDKSREEIKHLTMPYWALGDLLDIGVKLSGIQGKVKPSISNKSVYIFSCDHGITEENVSLYPKEVTAQMIENFMMGGAAINVLSKHAGMSTKIVDVGVDADLSRFKENVNFFDRKIKRGTKNFFKEDSMQKEDALNSLTIGFEMVVDSFATTDVYAIGEMGIGNTTTSSAMVVSLLQASVEEVTGKGTGIDNKTYSHKINVIKKSIENRKINKDLGPLAILTKIGSFEIGAMAGMCLACAVYRRPVLIDGFISSTAALLAYKLNPLVREYMFLSHRSVEPGHQKVMEELQLEPILDLKMRLGEGSGTALAVNVLEASCKILTEMATFKNAKISSAK